MILYRYICTIYDGGFLLQVMVMAVYQPGNVEISTTISIGVIGVMVMVILFYLWLCVVSLYQSLKEIQNLGSDQARILW